MSHNFETINDAATSALTIADEPATANGKAFREVRITKLGGFLGSRGIRIKARRLGVHTGAVTEQIDVDIRREDLYALREFLAELPEEAFVRPADPVEKPERWVDGDIIEEWLGGRRIRVWVRDTGIWVAPNTRATLADWTVQLGLGYDPRDHMQWAAVIIRQASGQDL